MGRFVAVLLMVCALLSLAVVDVQAGGSAVRVLSVPSCQAVGVQSLAVPVYSQGVQSLAVPSCGVAVQSQALAVPVYSQGIAVQAQAVPVYSQSLGVVQSLAVVPVGHSRPRAQRLTPLGAAAQAFRDAKFGRR